MLNQMNLDKNRPKRLNHKQERIGKKGLLVLTHQTLSTKSLTISIRMFYFNGLFSISDIDKILDLNLDV